MKNNILYKFSKYLKFQQEIGIDYNCGLSENEKTSILKKKQNTLSSKNEKIQLEIKKEKTIDHSQKNTINNNNIILKNTNKSQYDQKTLEIYGIKSNEVYEIIKKNEEICSQINTIEELKNIIDKYDSVYFSKNSDLTKKNAVFGEGVMKNVLLIGEAPGENEDIEKKPFVGRSGKLLDKALSTINISRNENLFITNCLYWRPPLNRKPEIHELDICFPFLKKTIELMNPKIIITAGITPFFNLTRLSISMKEAINNVYEFILNEQKIPIFPIYHPSFLLRMGSKKKDMWENLLKIAKQNIY